MTLDPRWTEYMKEIDRLYHANTTSEGRIECIADYVVRLVNYERDRAIADALESMEE